MNDEEASLVYSAWWIVRAGIIEGIGQLFVTGSLDQSVAEWDVESSSSDPVCRFSCEGLVNCVSMTPADPNIFFFFLHLHGNKSSRTTGGVLTYRHRLHIQVWWP